MVVRHVSSEAEFQSLLSKNGNNNADKLVIVDFSAVWCGPCKMIAPVFEELSRKYGSSSVEFYSVDVDQCPDLAQEHKIRAMPTFLAFKNNLSNELARIQGADPQALEQKIKELAAQYQVFSGQGNKLGGGGGAPNVSAKSSQSNLSLDEISSISQAKIEYSLSSCVRVGFRFLPAVGGGVLAGAKPFVRVNGDEKISKLRDYLDSLLDLGGVKGNSYVLHQSYPPAKLDEERTVNDANVGGAVVIVKFT